MFGLENLEWRGYLMVKKFDVFSRFDRIPVCDGRTSFHSIVCAVHSMCGKNEPI